MCGKLFYAILREESIYTTYKKENIQLLIRHD